MKRILLSVFLMMSAVAAFGQGSYYSTTAVVTAANASLGQAVPLLAVPFAAVTVSVPVYSDVALTQIVPQPISADVNGRFGFYVAAGTYTYTMRTPFRSPQTIPFSVGGGTATGIPFIQGPALAPTGGCSTIGWVLSQDGHATFCNGTSWMTKI